MEWFISRSSNHHDKHGSWFQCWRLSFSKKIIKYLKQYKLITYVTENLNNTKEDINPHIKNIYRQVCKRHKNYKIKRRLHNTSYASHSTFPQSNAKDAPDTWYATLWSSCWSISDQRPMYHSKTIIESRKTIKHKRNTYMSVIIIRLTY